MNETFSLIVGFATGILLGAIFFGGLWWTVRRALTSPLPALWFLGSLFLRTGIALCGFYAVSLGNWHRLIAALAGFVVARLFVAWLTHPSRQSDTGKEVSHAA